MFLVLSTLVFLAMFSFLIFIHGYFTYNPFEEKIRDSKQPKKMVVSSLNKFWNVSDDTVVSPNEAFTWAVFGALIAAVISVFIEPMLVPAVGMLVFLFLPRFVQSMKTRTKIKAFKENMEFIVSVLQGSLEAGMSFNEALAEMHRVAPKVMKDEINRVYYNITATKIPANQAFASLSTRVPCTETEELSDAVELYTRVGGRESLNLLRNVLRNIRESITARNRVAQETKGVKTSGLIVGVLPLVYIVIMQFVARDLMKTLYETDMGRIILVLCFIIYVFGAWMMYMVLKGVEEF